MSDSQLESFDYFYTAIFICRRYLPPLTTTNGAGSRDTKIFQNHRKNILIHLTASARFHGNKSGEGNTQKEEQIPIKLETLVKLPTFTQPENNLPPSSSTLPSLPTHCQWQNSDNVGEHLTIPAHLNPACLFLGLSGDVVTTLVHLR